MKNIPDTYAMFFIRLTFRSHRESVNPFDRAPWSRHRPAWQTTFKTRRVITRVVNDLVVCVLFFYYGQREAFDIKPSIRTSGEDWRRSLWLVLIFVNKCHVPGGPPRCELLAKLHWSPSKSHSNLWVFSRDFTGRSAATVIAKVFPSLFCFFFFFF